MSGARTWGVWKLVGMMLACGGGPQGDAKAPAEPGPEGDVSAESAASDAPAESGAASGASSTSGGAAAASSGAPDAGGLPTECTTVGELCVPPREFVKKLCQDAYTGVALRLFDRSTPFSRGYVRSREVQAVNTLGGPSSDQALRFDEEVLILSYTGGPGAQEMQVSGMSGYAVLRWDGTCATLGDGELGTRAPRSPGHAPIGWKYIDTNIQTALMKVGDIEEARREHRKHCHGVSLGRISAACARADGELAQSIVSAIRTGSVSLPLPDRMP